jgi:hypothetical protein
MVKFLLLIDLLAFAGVSAILFSIAMRRNARHAAINASVS